MQKISKYALWGLMALSFVLLLCFYLMTGDETIDVAGDALPVPTLTNPLLYWVYILIGCVALSTVASVALQYVIKFKTDRKSAIKSLLTACALVVLMVVTFFIGSSEKMDIIGYEGTDNQGFWAQFTDMCLYSIYALVVIAVLAIIGSYIYKIIKK
ncbi:MAG: hypothetical protein J6W49_07060 [Paludibacteraceae bacterium]|nr:hypothetical protein [Paludibacteraceae bacterium]